MTLSFPQYTFRFFAPAARTRRFGARSGLVAALVRWRQRRRTRQHLSTLEDRALADVVLTRAQQRSECAKPFWQL
jgi:uncharacterized protein YjiS (DUF1127 family)